MIVRQRLMRLCVFSLSVTLGHCIPALAASANSARGSSLRKVPNDGAALSLEPHGSQNVSLIHHHSQDVDPLPSAPSPAAGPSPAKAPSGSPGPAAAGETKWYKVVPKVDHNKARGGGYRKGSPFYAHQDCVQNGLPCDMANQTKVEWMHRAKDGAMRHTKAATDAVGDSLRRYASSRPKIYYWPWAGRLPKETESTVNRYLPVRIGPMPGDDGEGEVGEVTDSRNYIKWLSADFAIILFAVLYYFLIVRKYPKLPDGDWVSAPRAAMDYKAENPVAAVGSARCPVCFHALCCFVPRAAHTFHSAGVMGYWYGCILMQCFPCCTLFCMNQFTTLTERLGGIKRNMCLGAVCSCLCSCCVVTQDAQTLDIITGAETGLCGVTVPQQFMEQQQFGARRAV